VNNADDSYRRGEAEKLQRGWSANSFLYSEEGQKIAGVGSDY